MKVADNNAILGWLMRNNNLALMLAEECRL